VQGYRCSRASNLKINLDESSYIYAEQLEWTIESFFQMLFKQRCAISTHFDGTIENPVWVG